MIGRQRYPNKLIWKDKDSIKGIVETKRCGKSTLLEIFINALATSGIKKAHIIIINLEDPKANYNGIRKNNVLDWLLKEEK